MNTTKREYKTFYSVTYSRWGARGTSEAWFDNRKAADEFSDHDYHDNPVAHRASKPETIKEYERNVAMTKYELNNR